MKKLVFILLISLLSSYKTYSSETFQMIDLFSKEHLDHIECLWELSHSYTFIQKTANYVYEGDLKDKKVIIKVTPESRRSFDSVNAEIDFMKHLQKNNIAIAKPISTSNGEYCEKIKEKDENYTVIVIEKILGHCPEKKDFSEKLAFEIGKTLALMHQSTQTYPISEEESKRHNWKGQIWPTIDKYLSLNLDPMPANNLIELAKKLNSSSKSKTNYGLIHADLHPDNFFILDDDSITVFDFDTCCYHWFLYDLATTFIHTHLHFENLGCSIDEQALKEALFKGYQSIRILNSTDIAFFDDMLNLRAYVVYCWASVQLSNNNCDKIGMKKLNNFIQWMPKYF